MTSSRRSHWTSGSSCTMWRTPLNFGWRWQRSSVCPISGVGQIHPGDHAANQIVSRGQIEQPPGFLDERRSPERRRVPSKSVRVRESARGLREDSFFEERIPRAASMGSPAGRDPRNAGARRFASTYILTLLTYQIRRDTARQAELHARGTALRNQRTAGTRRGSDAARNLYQCARGNGISADACPQIPAESSVGRTSFSPMTCGRARRVSRRRKAGAARSAR